MQIAGDPYRVRLTTDLTRYHTHLEAGAKGTVIPNVKCSVWGTQDRFGAVRFDCCGAMLDILFQSLERVNGEATP